MAPGSASAPTRGRPWVVWRRLGVVYVYDDPQVPFSLGRLTAIVRDGESVDYEYDRFGRITRDGALTYAYDANGNQVEIGYAGDVRAVFTDDYADRPSTLDVEGLGGTLMQPIVTDAGYLPSGALDSLGLGNGLTETRPYDERYHPDRITVAGRSTPLDWDYTTDDVGNVLTITDVSSTTPTMMPAAWHVWNGRQRLLRPTCASMVEAFCLQDSSRKVLGTLDGVTFWMPS